MRKLTIIKKGGKGDSLLLIAVTMLAIVGCVFIYSASNYSASATYNDPFYFVKKQAIGILLGVLVMIITANYDYTKLKKWCVPVSIISFWVDFLTLIVK